MATKVATKPKAAPKAVAITDPIVWAGAVIVEMNAILAAKGDKRRVPITLANVETLLKPITGEGSLGQQGGFLRDNNPWNIGTYCGPTGPGAYGGVRIAKFGPDPRCSGGSVGINTFASPVAGARATAQYLLDHNALVALVHGNAPSAMVLNGTWYKGDAAAAPAVSVTTSALTAAARLLGSGPIGPGGPIGQPAPGKVNASVAASILKWANTSGHGVHWPASLTARYHSLSTADQQATSAAVYATLKKQGNLSLWGEVQAAGGGVASGVTSTAKAAVSSATAVASFLGHLSDPAFWKRIGIGAAGVALVVGGAAIFLSTTKPVQSGAKAAAGLL